MRSANAGQRGPRKTGAVIALALHGLAAYALLSYEPARSALLAAAPIMVDLIVPPKLEPQPERPVEIAPPPRPKPKPVAKPRPKPPEPEPLPVITAPALAASPVVAPPPPERPARPEPDPAPVLTSSVAPPVPAPIAVTPPVFNADYVENPPPAYPALSRRLGEQGRVILRVLVNPAGSADDVQVRSSSGHPRLDAAARDTVRGWKFVPARRGGQPVAAWVLIPISFRLES